MKIKGLVVASFAAALLAIGVAGTASAQTTVGDGLVNVAVGNVTILENVDIGAAVNAVVLACDLVDVEAVAGIIADVDAGETNKATFCKAEGGKVRVTQN